MVTIAVKTGWVRLVISQFLRESGRDEDVEVTNAFYGSG